MGAIRLGKNNQIWNQKTIHDLDVDYTIKL